MQEARIIKTISDQSICPHCNKSIVISSRMTVPVIDWVLCQKDIENAKKKLKEELNNVTFKNEERKKEVLNWIELEDTLFSPAEIPIILDQLKKDNS